MSPEQAAEEPLTDEQTEIANIMIVECGLMDVANEPLTILGRTGTVLYGLGRCYEKHLSNLTPEEIRGMVFAKLEQQANQ